MVTPIRLNAPIKLNSKKKDPAQKFADITGKVRDIALLVAPLGAVGVGVKAVSKLSKGKKILSAVKSVLPSVSKKVASSVGKGAVKVVTNPVQVVKGVAGAGIVAGGGLTILPSVFKGTKEATKKAIPVLKGEKELGGDTIKDVAKVVGLGLGIGAVGTGAGIVAEKILNRDKEKVVQELAPTTPQETAGGLMPSVSPISPSQDVNTPPLALTPQTEEIKTGRRASKRRKTKSKDLPSIYNKINVIVSNKANSTGIRMNKKYLKGVRLI